MKVGAIEHREELGILEQVRTRFSPDELEIRLDANGAWNPGEAGRKLAEFAGFGIHSLEQPLAPGQPEQMAAICVESPIPIALDEELTGITGGEERQAILERIRPHYLILKPGLLGGFRSCHEWIRLAGSLHIGWWVTSALESSIGLSAIAQWTASLGTTMPQGLGTGQLYTNNIPSPLSLEGDRLWYRNELDWDLQSVKIT
jgi:L-alanine-DL-glutamate epimerase-like enolase superfamily enzyme